MLTIYSKMMQRTRNFCITVNNYTEEEFQQILNTEGTKYVVLGREVAPTTLTPHIQGFIQFNNAISVTTARNKIKVPCYVGICNGTPLQNMEYCKKEGFFTERGDPPKGQGTRSDLVSVYKRIQDGEKLSEIVHTNFNEVVKYHRGIQLAADLIRGLPRTDMTLGYWLYGGTGTGKSRWAFSHPVSTYSKDPSNRWFDGYDYEDVVVIDDYRPSKEFPYNFLLRLCDRYPMSVEFKGGYKQFNSKFIIITSPVDIATAFAHLNFVSEGSIAQLKRRFKEVDFDLENIVENLVLHDLI